MSSDSKDCFDLLINHLTKISKFNRHPLRILEGDITMMNYKGYSNLKDIYDRLYMNSTDSILPRFAP